MTEPGDSEVADLRREFDAERRLTHALLLRLAGRVGELRREVEQLKAAGPDAKLPPATRRGGRKK